MRMTMDCRLIAPCVAALIALGCCTGATPVKGPPDPACPEAIPVEMYDKVESARARPGQVFRFRVEHTVTVDGGRFLKGTWGYGVVRAVAPASRGDVYGTVAIEPRYLMLAFGHRQEVMIDPHLPAAFSSRTSNVDRATGSIPTIGPGMAITAVNMVRFGRNVTLGPGFTFLVVPLFDLSEGGAC